MWCLGLRGLPRRRKRGGLYADPDLDDEKRLADLEARLSRESCADAFNSETFGEDIAGWTFEEALVANASLPTRCLPNTMGSGFDLLGRVLNAC
mmetsp:Transcript_35917/g.95334  ORF Transcript_35917/g.95334 Transcript_35917/m.95334 type:complete len:94 (+) Transcript_35917:618-899(+)